MKAKEGWVVNPNIKVKQDSCCLSVYIDDKDDNNTEDGVRINNKVLTEEIKLLEVENDK